MSRRIYHKRIEHIATDYDIIIKATADALNIDEMRVRLCVDYIFGYISRWIKSPFDHHKISITELGTFRINPTGLDRALWRQLGYLRKDRDNEDLKRQFRRLWRFREMIIKDVTDPETGNTKGKFKSKVRKADWDAWYEKKLPTSAQIYRGEKKPK